MGIKFLFKYLYLCIAFSRSILFMDPKGTALIFFQLNFINDETWVGFRIIFLPILVELGLPKREVFEIKEED